MTEVQTMAESPRIITVDANRLKAVTSPDVEIVSQGSPAASDENVFVDPSGDDLLQTLSHNPFMNPDNSVYDLIRRSDYLQKYPSWLGYLGPENKKKFPPTYIGRNDTIWELVFTERGYVDMLLMVRDLYMLPFPDFEADQSTGYLDGVKLRDALFPELDKLIEAHERILRLLLALHDHSPDHVVQSLGCCLLYLLDDETQKALSKLYGGFMFAQKRIRKQLQICKHIPVVALFFEKCRQDPRSARRSLEDCHMVIVQHWTKVETLLDAIIKNTLNHPVEVKNLETTKKTVRTLLKGAEQVMIVQEHAEKLAEFSEHFSPESSDDPNECYVRKVMKDPSSRLINYGSLRVSVGQTSVDVIGVALNDCFFVLQQSSETSDRYHLFKDSKMPPVLRWGQVYGYFRRAMIKSGYGFFILLQAESVLTLFQCSTIDELNRWEAIINEGFAKWDAVAPCTLEDLDEEWQQARNAIAERWTNTEVVFTLLHELDADLEQAWAARTCVSLALIEERLKAIRDEQGQLASTSSLSRADSQAETNNIDSTAPQPKLSTPTSSDSLEQKTFYSITESPGGLDQIISLFRELFVRLQFTLVGNSASLSRSASDIDERKRPPIKPLKKNETFGGRDIPKPLYDLKSMSERKGKKRDSHRLTSTVANIFRSGSREKAMDASSSSISAALKSSSRPPPTNLNISSRPSPLSSGATPTTPNYAQRASLSVGEHPLHSMLSFRSPNESNTGSSNSLNSRPSVEALHLLKDLTELAEEFLPTVFELRTTNEELTARIRQLESEKTKLEDIYTRARQHGFISAAGQNGSDVPPDAPLSFSVKQETEKLRQDVENFRKRSEEWEKEYKRQRDALERDHAKLAKEWTRIDEAKSELEKRQHQYDEARKTLQQQLDLYDRQGLRFTGINVPDIQLPCDNAPSSIPLKNVRRESSTSLADLTSLSFRAANSPPSGVPMHAHSTSDGLTGQWANSTGLFKDSRTRESTVPSDEQNDATPRPSLVPQSCLRPPEELPLHLRGSLVNQRAQLGNKPTGKPPASLATSLSGNRPAHTSDAQSSCSSTSALFKLADSSKPQSSSNKPKKSNIFRRN